jgi:quercetin dioxygenase-like cupin family protein
MTQPSRTRATSTLRLETERVRATESAFRPGAETGWHRHAHDYVIVPLTDGSLLLEEPGGGTRTSALELGIPYARPTGVEHNVINAGDTDLAFLEIELVENEVAERRRFCLDRFIAAWNAHDVDSLMACMAEDCAFYASAGPDAEGEAYRGRTAVRAGYAAVFEAFPDAAWTNGRHFLAGDRGVSEWRFLGTDRQGTKVAVDGCDLFTFDGDLIKTKNSFRKQRK